MSKMKKVALVLSGGGSRGSFQVGAINYLREKGFTFDCVAGVSVGSLNGSMIAQNKYDELNQVWNTVKEGDVHKKNGWLKILWNNLVMGKKSLYDLRPLYTLLNKHISKVDIKIPFYLGITSLYTGEYYSLEAGDFCSDKTLIDGVYASSLMPIIWEPIDVTVGNKVIKSAVDGGVKNVTPLSDILKENPDQIIIITCNNAIAPVKDQKNIIQVADRTFLGIMLNEVVDNDIRQLLWINNLVKQAEAAGTVLRHPETGRIYKYFDIILITPPITLNGATDFSRVNIDRNLKLGYETAAKKFNDFSLT